MATFEIVTRTKKEWNQVKIRICHRSKTAYMDTSMTVHRSSIRKGKIADRTVMANCAIRIKKYVDRLNTVDTGNWTVQEVKRFLESESGNISFTDFANEFILQMKKDGREKPSANYRSALKSMTAFMKRERLLFSDITANGLREWIKSLSDTSRAKNMYPNCIRSMFDAGCMKYNDYDRNIMRIA